MAYTFRILPEADYSLLGVPVSTLPQNGVIGVVERSGTIIARWMAGSTCVLEGLYIEEQYRKNPAVAKMLLTGMIDELRRLGVSAVITLIQDHGVAQLAETAGFRCLPGWVYQLDLRET